MCNTQFSFCFLLHFSFFWKEKNLRFKHNLQPFIIFFGASIQVDEAHFHNICTHYTCSEQRECYTCVIRWQKFWFKKQSFLTFFDAAVELCSSIKTIIFSISFLQNLIDLSLNLRLFLVNWHYWWQWVITFSIS